MNIDQQALLILSGTPEFIYCKRSHFDRLSTPQTAFFHLWSVPSYGLALRPML